MCTTTMLTGSIFKMWYTLNYSHCGVYHIFSILNVNCVDL